MLKYESTPHQLTPSRREQLRHRYIEMRADATIPDPEEPSEGWLYRCDRVYEVPIGTLARDYATENWLRFGKARWLEPREVETAVITDAPERVCTIQRATR